MQYCTFGFSKNHVSAQISFIISRQKHSTFVCHSLLSRIQSAQTTTMSGNSNDIVGNGHSKDSTNADPFIYVCGKCPREFGSAAERDSHKANCNRPPNTSGETQCIHDANSFPTGSDET